MEQETYDVDVCYVGYTSGNAFSYSEQLTTDWGKKILNSNSIVFITKLLGVSFPPQIFTTFLFLFNPIRFLSEGEQLIVP